MTQMTLDEFLAKAATDSVNATPPHTRARRKDPDTSKAAAKTLGHRTRHAAYVMAALRDSGYRGMTSEEVTEEYHGMLTHAQVWRRMSELEAAGHIEKVAEKRKNRSGRMARVWRVTNAD